VSVAQFGFTDLSSFDLSENSLIIHIIDLDLILSPKTKLKVKELEQMYSVTYNKWER
jgi:hypothetical protein